jgi:hypothetical protein
LNRATKHALRVFRRQTVVEGWLMADRGPGREGAQIIPGREPRHERRHSVEMVLVARSAS